MAMCKVFLDLSVAEIKTNRTNGGRNIPCNKQLLQKTIFSMLLWDVMNDLKEVSIIYM